MDWIRRPPGAGTLGDQRGTVLPVALLVLSLMTALTFAFASLGTSEPAVSRNHVLAAQARAFAESGIERALWALSSGAMTFTASPPTADAPYNNTFIRISENGGFSIIATDPGSSTERLVTAVGWAPDSTGIFRGVRKIQATVIRLPWSTTTPACALCVRGNLDVGGSAQITAWSEHGDVSFCANAPGGGTMSTGNTSRGGSASVWGPGNADANESADMPDRQPNSAIPGLSWEDLRVLRIMAQRNNAYFRGPTRFDGDNLLPSWGGIVFVDTTTGNDLTTTPDPTPTEQMGNVTITGNQTFRGWIIAIGDITVTGTVNLTGTLYARNDFVFNGNGTITGSVTAENFLGTLRSSVDSSAGGSSRINYNCQSAQTGGGTISPNLWVVKPGTFTEASGT